MPTVKCCVGAGDGWRLIHRQGETLRGVGAHAVLRGERDGIAAVQCLHGCSAEHASGSGEGHTGRQRPDSESVGAGTPVAVTVKEPAVPTVKVVLLALVMAGA